MSARTAEPVELAKLAEPLQASDATIGFEHRLDYSAIGPATNLAARLCAQAKNLQILISPRVLAKVEERIEVESVGDLELKGFHRPVPAYNVLGLRDGDAAGQSRS